MPNPHTHPNKGTHVIHPKKFKSGQATGLFIYGEKFLQPPKVRGVKLASKNHDWNINVEDIQNAYIDLTATTTPKRSKRSRGRGDDDLTITLVYDSGPDSDPITVCGIPIDDSRWFKDQEKAEAKKKKEAAAAAGAMKKRAARKGKGKKAS